MTEKKSIVKIFGRKGDNQSILSEEFSCKSGLLEEVDTEYDILVNATPVGMHPNVEKMVIPEDRLKKDSLIFDIVYNPIETMMIKKAEEKGCRTVKGTEMFLEQAYEQFRLFTEKEPPKEIMRKILLKELKNI